MSLLTWPHVGFIAGKRSVKFRFLEAAGRYEASPTAAQQKPLYQRLTDLLSNVFVSGPVPLTY